MSSESWSYEQDTSRVVNGGKGGGEGGVRREGERKGRKKKNRKKKKERTMSGVCEDGMACLVCEIAIQIM